MRLFTYVGSYSEDSGLAHEYDVKSSLREAGWEQVEPSYGPRLTPTTRAATNHVVRGCARKGFAFPEEKQVAVQTLLVLNQIREPFVPTELEVYAATHGFDVDQAHEYRVFAEKVQDGRSFRPAIRLAPGQADRYVDYWASNPDG